jgi:twitching motility protein PilT
VLTTLHSATAAEALARIVAAFPAEIQPGICAQLADSLVGVICQRLRWWEERGVRAPECEVLLATTQVRAMVQQGHFFKLATALDTGGREGCWSFSRYREWLEKRTDWWVPSATPPEPASSEPAQQPLALPSSAPRPQTAATTPRRPPRRGPERAPEEGGVIEIGEADDDLVRILSELERK